MSTTVPYPTDVYTDEGVSFQCPCDPEGERNDTYICLRRDVLEGSDSTECGGCGRVYRYSAHISEYLEIEGDTSWIKSL